jgi:hypothetical protein
MVDEQSGPQAAAALSPASGSTRRNRFHRSGGRSWSQEIESTAASLRMRVQMIRNRPPPHGATEAERAAICAGVEDLVLQATSAAQGDDPEYRSFRSWWRGTSVEAAFRKSHQAESELVRLYDDVEVEAEVPVALGRAEVALNRDDPMREAARRLVQMGPGPHKRLLLSKVVQAGHEAADGTHTRIRNFRNILLSTTFCVAVLVLVFSVVVATNPTAVPLCFQPQGGTTMACPTGDGAGQQPTSLDVVVVVLLGLLGGSLAAAVSIRNLRGTQTPYDVPIALSLLKAPAGALTAVGALIAIRGAFIPGLSELDSQEQILAYALIFGYAQQLLTGLIDRQADQLLGSVPSKDAEQSRPQLPTVPAPDTSAHPLPTPRSPLLPRDRPHVPRPRQPRPARARPGPSASGTAGTPPP